MSRAAQAGWRITPRQLFERQTVARLAAVAERTAGRPAASQGPVEGPVSLTPIQRWFFGLRPVDPHHFNQALLLRVAPAPGVGPQALAGALAAVLRHHDALRLRFTLSDDGPRAENAPPAPPDGPLLPVVPIVDLAALHASGVPGATERALEEANAAVQRSLDLERPPLLRTAWYEMAGGPRLLLAVHHLAIDGVSWRVLLADLESACRQLAAGAAPADLALPPKTTSFREWAERLEAHARELPEAAVERELAYWSGLSRMPHGPLPIARAAGAGPGDGAGAETGRVASARTATVELDAESTRALLTEVPAAYGTQINDVLLAALAAGPARLAGRRPLGRPRGARPRGGRRRRRPVAHRRLVHHPLPGGAGGRRRRRRAGRRSCRSIKEQLRAVPERGFGYGVLRHLGGGAAAARLAALPRAAGQLQLPGRRSTALRRRLPLPPADEPSGPAQSPRQRRAAPASR